MALQPVPSGSAPVAPQRIVRTTPQRLIAGALLLFSAGFLFGYWYHQPSEPAYSAELVSAIKQAQKETDRILTEQRQLLHCTPIDSAAPAASTTRTHKAPR